MKTHIFRSKEPVTKWPDKVLALCGDEIKNPRPVMSIGPDGRMEAQNTIYFCQDCGTIALVTAAELVGPQWHYGITTAEHAHRLNLQNRVED